MVVRYENDYGHIDLHGGRENKIRILQIEGLGPPGKEYNIADYAGQPGQELISEKDLARTITVSIDIVSPTSSLQYEIKRIVKILYFPGKLLIRSGGFSRSIECRCTKIDEPMRYGKKIARMVIQFTCDNPYFTGQYPESVSLYHQGKLLQTTFTLPCAFSSRYSRMNIINAGDIRAEPVIKIYCSKGTDTTEDAYGINIANHTTSQSILLERILTDGEEIVIDIPNRKVTSSTKGDITYSISLDTFLNDFWLEVGNNDLEVVSYNSAEEISVVIQYHNKYIEAVY